MPAVWSRVDNGHDGWEWGDYMHGMCGRAVQRSVDGGVRGVSGGIGDEHAVRCWRHDMHGVWRRAVQQRIDGGVRSVCRWLGAAPGSRVGRDNVLGMCSGSVQECWLDVCVPGVPCGVSNGHAAGCRRHDMHGMPGGAVHQHIDPGLRGVSERDVRERECGRVRGVCGGAVRR